MKTNFFCVREVMEHDKKKDNYRQMVTKATVNLVMILGVLFHNGDWILDVVFIATVPVKYNDLLIAMVVMFCLPFVFALLIALVFKDTPNGL